MKTVRSILLFALTFVVAGALLHPKEDGVPYYNDLFIGLIAGALFHFIMLKADANYRKRFEKAKDNLSHESENA